MKHHWRWSYCGSYVHPGSTKDYFHGGYVKYQGYVGLNRACLSPAVRDGSEWSGGSFLLYRSPRFSLFNHIYCFSSSFNYKIWWSSEKCSSHPGFAKLFLNFKLWMKQTFDQKNESLGGYICQPSFENVHKSSINQAYDAIC